MNSEQHIMRLVVRDMVRGLLALFFFVTYLGLFYIPFAYEYIPRVFQLSAKNVTWGRVDSVSPCDIPVCVTANITYYLPNRTTDNAQSVAHRALMSGEQFAQALAYSTSLLQRARESLADLTPQVSPATSRWRDKDTIIEEQVAAQPTQMRTVDDLIVYISALDNSEFEAKPMLPPHLTWLIPSPEAYILLQHFPAGAPWPYLPPFVHYWLIANTTLLLIGSAFLSFYWLRMPIRAGIYRLRFLRAMSQPSP